MGKNRSLSTARTVLAGLGMGAVALLGVACTPAPAPTPTTTTVPSGGTTTTTSNVNYDCNGVGLSSSAVIADQVTSVDVTLPNSVAAGATFSVGVDVGNLSLSAAPSFLDLNSAGVNASIAVAGANGPAVGPVSNFVGNGASVNLNPVSTTATAVAGVNTVTVGVLTIVVGSTGFVCTPIGAGASASVTAS